MKSCCPNPRCFNFRSAVKVCKDGHYFRSGDSRLIQRFCCQSCGKKFSTSTHALTYRQKKRRINSTLFQLMASGVTMRRCAKIIGTTRTTVHRRLRFFALRSKQYQKKLHDQLKKNQLTHVHFDDLITSEHTKMKPLTVTIAVSATAQSSHPQRLILAAQVGRIPAFGLLAERSRKKYGQRENQHHKTLKEVFDKIQPLVHPEAILSSDEHQNYPAFVARYFPKGTHRAYPGGRGAVVGQGELKRLKFDPLFAINHTCAMLRANINRLIRKTWSTTKDPLYLQDHIDLYIHYHNKFLLQRKL